MDTFGCQLANDFFNIIGLNSEMMNASPTWVLGGLIIEMKPSVSNFHKNVSRASKFCVKNNFPFKKFLIELDALLNIRGKNMYVMDVTNQVGLLLIMLRSSDF